MRTPEQRAEFQAASKALTELRKRRGAEMLAIFRGEKAPDRQHLLTQAAELVRAHKRFMNATEPFTGWGGGLNT